jgi:hypothetical protein
MSTYHQVVDLMIMHIKVDSHCVVKNTRCIVYQIIIYI